MSLNRIFSISDYITVTLLKTIVLQTSIILSMTFEGVPFDIVRNRIKFPGMPKRYGTHRLHPLYLRFLAGEK